METNNLLTVEELADTLKVNARTIHRFVQRRELPAIRVGRQWRFRREWVEAWLKERTVNLDEETA